MSARGLKAVVFTAGLALAGTNAHAQATAKDLLRSGMNKSVNQDWNGAVADYSQAVALEPANEKAHVFLGIAHEQVNDLDGAIADYSRLIALKPKEAGYRKDRAKVLLKKGDLEGATKDILRALELKPGDEHSYQLLGNVHMKKGDFNGAVAQYTKAIDQKSGNSTLFRDRAAAYRALSEADEKKEAEASAEFKRVLREAMTPK